MKKFVNLCLITLLIISACVLNGCKKKEFSVDVFSKVGGYITINDSKDKIDYKETLVLKKKKTITFRAYANEGYDFDYWEIDSQAGPTEEVLTLTVTKGTVVAAFFKAEGEADSYVLSFVDENDAKIGSDITVEDNETFTLPTVESRDGYRHVFVDVNNSNNVLDPELASEFTFNYGANKTFKLKYISTSTSDPTPTTYTLTFQDETGATINTVTDLENNSKFGLPTVADKTGFRYVFVDVDNTNNVLDPDIATEFTFNYGANKTFKLKYIATSTSTPTTYTITFQDDTGVTINTVVDLEDNDTFVLPAVVDKTGFRHVFVDVDNSNNILDPSLATEFTFNYGANKTFKLKYIATSTPSVPEVKHTITFVDENNNQLSSYEIAEGVTIILPSSTSYTVPAGYTAKFVDKDDTNTEISATYTYTTDKTFILKLTPNVYTVSFVESQYQTTIPSINVTYGTAIDLPDVNRPGSTAQFFYNTTEIKEGDIYTYAQHITIRVVFITSQYTISYPTESYYTIALVSGSSWSVGYGGSVAFTVTPNASYKIGAVKYEGQLIASVNGVYTISNITSNGAITVEVNSTVVISTNLDTTALDLFTIQIPSTVNYTQGNSASNYIVPINSIFEFNINPSTSLTFRYYVDGKATTINNNAVSFAVGDGDIIIVRLEAISTLSYDFDLGRAGGTSMEATDSQDTITLAGNIVKTGTSYYHTVDSSLKFNITQNNQLKELSLAQIVEYYNTQAQSLGYRVATIQLTDGFTVVSDWLDVDYSTTTPTYLVKSEYMTINDMLASSILFTVIYERVQLPIQLSFGAINGSLVANEEAGYVELELDNSQTYYLIDQNSVVQLASGETTFKDLVDLYNNNSTKGTAGYRITTIHITDGFDSNPVLIDVNYASSDVSTVLSFSNMTTLLDVSNVDITERYLITFVWEELV